MNSRCKSAKSTFKKKVNYKKGFKGSYTYNKLGVVSFDDIGFDSFKCDGKNAFRHNRKANVRISTRRQRFSKPPEVATDFYYEFDEIFRHFEEFDLPSYVIVDGCYDTNKHTIQKQIDCRNFSGRELPNVDDYILLSQSVRDTIRKLKITNLGEVNEEMLYDFDFDLDTKPGYRFEHYFKANKKRDCVDVAMNIAKKRYRSILKASRKGNKIKREDIIPGIYTIGARNKRETSCEVGEVLTSRAVHMPEWHTELHGGIFSDLITEKIVDSSEGPIYIGNSFVKFERLEKQIKQNEFAFEGDWKKFDASLCNSLVVMSLCILRLYFPMGLLYDNHFLAILDSLVLKDYHVVGGNVLRILHGLPSGSKWTSLVGSVLNLLVLNYVFSDVKYYDRSFAIGGDDFVTFVKENNYDAELIADKAIEKCSDVGMELKFLKTKRYKNSNNIDDYPVFYKYTVFKGVPVTPVESILERCLAPWNKKYKSNAEVLRFLDNLLPSLAFPSSSCYIFYYFYMYCYFRVTGKKVVVEDLVRKHYFLYRRMLATGVDPPFLSSSYNFNKRNTFVKDIKTSRYMKDVFVIG